MEHVYLKTFSLVYLLLFTLHPAEAFRCITNIPNIRLTDASEQKDSCQGNAGSICYYFCPPGYEENPVYPSLLCDSEGKWNASTEHLCFSTEEVNQFCKMFEGTWAKFAIGGLMAVGAIAAVPAILGLLGFGPLGPIAGGFAAMWMANMGNVAAGGLFAFLQALAMGGLGMLGKMTIFGGIQMMFHWLMNERCSDDPIKKRQCDTFIPSGEFDSRCVPTIGSACTYDCYHGFKKTFPYPAICLSNQQWNVIESNGRFCVPDY